MAIALVETDRWLQTLEFVGGQRQTPFGPMDGVFYGSMSINGDVSGGNVSLSGRLSEARKEDWVYVIGGSGIQVNTDADIEAFEQVNTGPLIPIGGPAGTSNVSLSQGQPLVGVVNNAVSVAPGTDTAWRGIPVFGDKKIAGVFLMYAAGFGTNVDGATYTSSIWGWVIRYSSFFRGVRPGIG